MVQIWTHAPPDCSSSKRPPTKSTGGLTLPEGSSHPPVQILRGDPLVPDHFQHDEDDHGQADPAAEKPDEKRRASSSAFAIFCEFGFHIQRIGAGGKVDAKKKSTGRWEVRLGGQGIRSAGAKM